MVLNVKETLCSMLLMFILYITYSYLLYCVEELLRRLIFKMVRAVVNTALPL